MPQSYDPAAYHFYDAMRDLDEAFDYWGANESPSALRSRGRTEADRWDSILTALTDLHHAWLLPRQHNA